MPDNGTDIVEGDDEETGTEDLDSEACIELLEHAGDVLFAFGNAMASQEFAPYFAGLLSALFHRAMSLFYFYDFLSIYLSNYFVCRGSIVRLRKSLSVPASWRSASNRWMAFWNRLYRVSTRLLPTWCVIRIVKCGPILFLDWENSSSMDVNCSSR
jgi:hypothetical protein